MKLNNYIQTENLVVQKENKIDNNISNFVLRGIPSSPGISFGSAFVIEPETVVIPTDIIDKTKINDELEKFESAKK